MSRSHRLHFLGVLAAPLLVLAISCAASDEPAPGTASPNTIPNDPSSDGGDTGPSPDATDASDGGCADGCAVSCDDGAMCMVVGAVGTQYALTSIWGSGANDIWAVGSGGTIVHWDGSGWVRTPSGTAETFTAVYGTGAKDVYALARFADIRHSDGFAGDTTTWTPLAIAERFKNVGVRARAAWGTSPEELYVGGDYIHDYDWVYEVELGKWNLWRREDVDGGIDLAGVEPTGDMFVTPQVLPTIRALWGTSATDLWALTDRAPYAQWGPGGANGGSVHRTANPDGGTPLWVAVNTQTTTGLKGLHGTSKDDVWAVGAGGAIRHFAAGQYSWAIVDSPVTEDLNCVWAIAPDDAWIVGNGGTILHYDGKAWTSAPVQWPRGIDTPSLYGVWASGPNDVWAVGDGIILHSSRKNSQ